MRSASRRRTTKQSTKEGTKLTLKKKGGTFALMGVVSLALLIGVLTNIGVQSQQGKANSQAQPTAKGLSSDDEATPIVNSTSQNVGDEKRENKNRRHNHGGLDVAESPGDSTEVVVSSESSMPDFPFKLSDLVVGGTVTDSNAFLSADRTGVYSEYTVAVSDLIKSPADSTVRKHDSITAERFGGRVRFPSGQIVRYKVIGRGSPVKNTKYIFFLRKVDADSYLILTAYELRGNQAFALDGSRVNRGRGDWPFDKHNGQDLTSFKKNLDKAFKGESNETYKVY
ncbi:MAG TPA: hypothetical protein VFF31_30405 [Blastocatellia bacterium]|nr:hypothetical protein [Blastocatellia bacterium]